MAGLAAALDAPGIIEALAVALAARGADGAMCSLESDNDVRLDVAMRAVLPAIPRVVGDPDGGDARVVAAFVIDGVASVTALDAGYAARGPAGLLGGEGPYAAILADAEEGVLVLARNGDGPGLYYARQGGGWVVASEPTALVRSGVPAEPDVEVVERFIETGACDDTDGTFFARIRRVRPGEAVVLAAGERVDTHVTPPTRRILSAAAALQAGVTGGRVGILLGPGLAGAALLGTALVRPDRVRPLPVHTATFPGLDGPASSAPAVLMPLPYGTIRHTEHTFESDALDRFLTEVGEPVPDLEIVTLWAVARDTAGGVDAVVDASRGEPACVARVSDRLYARYGVGVRCPLRDVEPAVENGRSDLESIVARTLPSAVARYPADDSAGPPSAAEILLSMRGAATAALATPRPWSDRGASVDAMGRLVDGESVDADALLRAYIVERWLRVVAAGDADAESAPDDVSIDGTTWARVPVRTEALAPGEQVAATVAWYVSKAVPDIRVDHGPWFAALAGKAVAVGQRRVCPLWEIRPGFAARALSRLARFRLPRLGDPWTMQVAIGDSGLLPVAVGTLASLLWLAWAERWLPVPAWTLYPPRPDAVAPADGAVVRGPFKADDAAENFLDALRYSLPADAFETLAGCAVLSADEWGSRVLGFALGPNADAVPDAESVLAEVCADNPFGQGRQRTPVVLAVATHGR